MLKHILIFTCCLSMGLFAQTVQEAVGLMEYEDGIGVKASGMGNAFTAVADDYTAIYWNPAGLASLEQSEITGAITHMNYQNRALYTQDADPGKLNTTKFKNLGFAHKVPTQRGSLVIGFGYHRFKDFDHLLKFSGFSSESNGLSFQLEDDWGVERDYLFDREVWRGEEILESGSLNALTAGAGIAVSPNFDLGISLQWINGKTDYLFRFYQEDSDGVFTEFPGNYSDYELHQELQTKLSGFSLKIGGLLRLNNSLTAGFSADLPTSLRIMETWSERDALRFDDDYISELESGPHEWEYIVRYPVRLSFGIAAEIQSFVFSADCKYRDWTQVRFDVPDNREVNWEYSDLLSENQTFNDAFRPVLSWGAGGEYRLAGTGMKVRGGYQVIPSSQAGMTEEADRHYYSGGIGYDLDRLSSLQISYRRGVWNRNTSDGYTPEGTLEKITTDRIMAGLTIKF